MKHATSRELFAYWNRIRGEESAPRRSDIEPGDIRRVLADTFILEVMGSASHRVRLAGTRMCALYGREIKGSNFLDLWSGEDRGRLAAAAARVCEEAVAAVVEVDLFSARDRTVACEFLLLPLRHGTTMHDRILGSCAVFRRPYWFGTDPVATQTISDLRLIGPGQQAVVPGHEGSRFITLPPAFLGGGQRHGHLYVIDGGKR